MKVLFSVPRERLDVHETHVSVDFVSGSFMNLASPKEEGEVLSRELKNQFCDSFSFAFKDGFILAKRLNLRDCVLKYAQIEKTVNSLPEDFLISYCISRGKQLSAYNRSLKKLDLDLENNFYARNIALFISMDENVLGITHEICFKKGNFLEMISKNFHEYERRRNSLECISGLLCEAVSNYLLLNVR